MSEAGSTRSVAASFPLYPIAILITVLLAVANALGWIHAELWVILLPIFVVVGISLATLVVVGVVLGAGFLVFLAVERSDRKKRAASITTPYRHRGIK